MNMKYISLLAISLLPILVSAQQIIVCDSNTTYWVFPHDSVDYSLKFDGEVQSTELPSAVTVDKYFLQYLFVDKGKFIQAGEDNSDLSILTRSALNECDYLTSIYKKKINVVFQKVPLGNQDVLLWYYEMPRKMKGNVNVQLYANMVVGDDIFGLYTPQFEDLEFNLVRDFLMDAMSSLEAVSDIHGLCAPKPPSRLPVNK